MKIIFTFNKGGSRESPEFPSPPEKTFDSFWNDFLGGDREDTELFWNSDVSGAVDTIIVDWFEDPATSQKIVDQIAKELQVSIPPFFKWKEVVR